MEQTAFDEKRRVKLSDANLSETLRALEEIAAQKDHSQIETLKNYQALTKSTFVKTRIRNLLRQLQDSIDKNLEVLKPDLRIAMEVFRTLLTPLQEQFQKLLAHPDQRVVHASGTLLVELGFPRASQWLLEEFLRNPESTGVIEPLLRSGDNSVIDYLIEEFKNPERKSRREIVLALGDVPSVYSVIPLLHTLVTEDLDIKIAAVKSLGRLRDRRSVAPLLNALENTQEPKLQFAIIDSLGSMDKEYSLIPLMEFFKKTSNPELKAFLVNTLAHFNVPEAVELLIETLRQDNHRARANACECLKNMPLPVEQKVALLLPLIEDVFPRTRANALGALWQFYLELEERRKELSPEDWKKVTQLKNKIIDGVYKMTQQLDKKMKLSAAYILRELNDVKFTPILLSLLKEEDEHIKKVASISLGFVNVTESINILMKNLLFEESHAVQLNILRALESIGSFSSSEIDNSLNKLYNETPVATIKAAVVATLGKLKDPEKRFLLFKEAVKSPEPRIRSNALEIIGRIVNLESTPILKGALGDTNYRVRGTAIASLLLLGEIDSLPHLFALAKSEESNEVLTALHVITEVCGKIRNPRDSREILLLFESLKRHPRFEQLKSEGETESQGNPQHEIEKFQNLLRLRPEDHLTRFLLCKAFHRGKSYREALREIDRLQSVGFEKPGELIFLKGLIYLDNRRVTQAMDIFRECLDLDFPAIDIKLELLYRIAVTLEPNFPSISYYYWELLQSIDDSYHDVKTRAAALRDRLKQTDTYKEVGPRHLAAMGIHKSYQLLSELGRGSEGVVFKATELHSETEKVVKIYFYPREADRPEFNDRMRKIHLLKDFKEPGLVALHEVVNLDRLKFVAMENGGDSLRKILKIAKTLPLADIIHVANHVASALFYLNLKGEHHGDLRPENILLDGERRVRLVDYGANLGKKGGTTGDANPYLPPEPPSLPHQYDLHAFGVILFEMATGLLPGHLAGGDFVPLTTIDPSLPGKLNTIVVKCLSLSGESYSSVKMVKEELRGLGNG